MSEQPLDVTEPAGQGGQMPYTWHDVARDKADWHEGLRIHADRLLAAHGITAPVPGEVGVAEPGETELPPVEPRVHPEQYRTTAGERKEAFASGLKTLYGITADPRLHAACESAGIDPFDTERPEYWRMVAQFAHERVADLRERTGQDSFRLRAIELVATTPAYLYEVNAFNQGLRDDPELRRESLRIQGNYRDGIAEMAQHFPDVKASEIAMGLLNSVNVAIEDKGMRQSAEFNIRTRIRGVQHEFGFDDVLWQTGVRYRRATKQEDRRGYDYVIDEHSPTEMHLDVKSRLREVTELGVNGPVARNDKGVYVVYSMIQDHEFRDGFHLPDDLAREKAKVLVQYLDIAREQQSSA